MPGSDVIRLHARGESALFFGRKTWDDCIDARVEVPIDPKVIHRSVASLLVDRILYVASYSHKDIEGLLQYLSCYPTTPTLLYR